jgi:hypothetical protein
MPGKSSIYACAPALVAVRACRAAAAEYPEKPVRMMAAIHRAMASLLQRRATRESLAAQGLKVHALPPAQFKHYVDDELTRWQSVIRNAGITAN